MLQNFSYNRVLSGLGTESFVLRTLASEHMILANFMTLHLKGSWISASEEIARQWHDGKGSWFARHVRLLARHYQNFEQLPKEKQGGVGNAHMWLADKAVETHVRDYLSNVPLGKVTVTNGTDSLHYAILISQTGLVIFFQPT